VTHRSGGEDVRERRHGMSGHTIAQRLRAATPAVLRAESRGWCYFDGPSGTQMIRPSIDTYCEFARSGLSNRHGFSPAGDETEFIMATARNELREMFHADDYDVVFGQNMTSLAFAFAHACARRRTPEGRSVVVTELEHAANDDSWAGPFAERGARTVAVPVTEETLDLDPDGFERIEGADDVAVVAVTGAANAVGVKPDLGSAHAFARAHDAVFVVDGVHLTPHGPPDLTELDPDLYFCSAYKFYGPHVGVALVKKGFAEELRPYKVAPAPESGGEKFETGSQNHEGIAALASTLCGLGELVGKGTGAGAREALASLAEHEATLARNLVEELKVIPGVRVFGHGDTKTTYLPTIAVTVEGMSPAVLARGLREKGVFVTAGDFWATRLARRLGVDRTGGWLRIGISGYITETDVERLVSALHGLIRAGCQPA
jgi:selenocysteine lyase/cysteine desulfurase